MNLDSLLQLALGHHQRSDWVQAKKIYQQILQSYPDHAQTLYLLAVAHYQSNELNLAAQVMTQFLQLMPKHDEGHNVLGNILQDQGDLDAAAQSFEKAIDCQPKNEKACNNLGTVHRLKNNLAAATKCFERSIEIKPDYFEAWNNLGNAYQDQQKIPEALAAYRRASDINPNYAQAHLNKGLMLQKMGDLPQALACFESALQADPKCHQARWIYWLSLPHNYQSEAEIVQWRARYEKGLTELARSIAATPLNEMIHHYQGMGLISPFYLGYQGHDDLPLQIKFGALCASVNQKIWADFLKPIQKKQHSKLRVGFVSAHIYQHTISKLFLGWPKSLDRSKYELFTYHVGIKTTPAVTQAWMAASDTFRHLNATAPQIAETILKDEIDVLIYLDIGMYPKINQLASMRLAPVQCLSWGHPVSSGFETMDYFLSSQLMGPENAERFYSEKLIQLANLSICYAQPKIDAPKRDRAFFGLRSDAIVYLCPQMLSKYLPSHDEIFVRIASQVSRAQFAFISDICEKNTQVMKSRLETAFASQGLSVSQFVHFVPVLNQEDYFNLNQVADLALDTPLWSGGNTTFEAIACGLPVITVDGPFMRSRHTVAILQQMGLPELIVPHIDAYVALATQLGQYPEVLQEMRQKIVARRDVIFDDIESVKSLEVFLDCVQ